MEQTQVKREICQITSKISKFLTREKRVNSGIIGQECFTPKFWTGCHFLCNIFLKKKFIQVVLWKLLKSANCTGMVIFGANSWKFYPSPKMCVVVLWTSSNRQRLTNFPLNDESDCSSISWVHGSLLILSMMCVVYQRFAPFNINHWWYS